MEGLFPPSERIHPGGQTAFNKGSFKKRTLQKILKIRRDYWIKADRSEKAKNNNHAKPQRSQRKHKKKLKDKSLFFPLRAPRLCVRINNLA